MVSEEHDNEVPTQSLLLEVLGSEAWRIQSRLYALAMVDEILRLNYEELCRLLKETLGTPPPDDWRGSDDPEWVSGVLDELARRLVNFLYSAKMRVEQSRAMRNKWYKGTSLGAEWESEAHERFSGNPVSGFIDDLRNFALHYRLPATSVQLNTAVDIGAGAIARTRDIVLSKPHLLQWSSWGKGKKYLETADNDIPILPLVTDYYQQAAAFGDWLRRRMEGYHAEELGWLGAMLARIKRTRRGPELVRESRGRVWLAMPRAPGGF
jgi:hypothetical protein